MLTLCDDAHADYEPSSVDSLPAERCDVRVVASARAAAAAAAVRVEVVRWRAGVYEARLTLGDAPIGGVMIVHIAPSATHPPACTARGDFGAKLSRCVAGGTQWIELVRLT